MINENKINRIVEYIRQHEFAFEICEVTEALNSVLAYYGLLDIELTKDEYFLLTDELLPLAEEFEFTEAEYLASQDNRIAGIS